MFREGLIDYILTVIIINWFQTYTYVFFFLQTTLALFVVFSLVVGSNGFGFRLTNYFNCDLICKERYRLCVTQYCEDLNGGLEFDETLEDLHLSACLLNCQENLYSCLYTSCNVWETQRPSSFSSELQKLLYWCLFLQPQELKTA